MLDAAPADQCNGSTVPSGGIKTISVAGDFGVPADALAVVLNVTVVNPAGPGFVTAYPAGSTVPPTSNIDYAAGQVVPNLVEVGTGTSGDVSFYSSNQTDLVVTSRGTRRPPRLVGPVPGSIRPSPPRLESVTREPGPRTQPPTVSATEWPMQVRLSAQGERSTSPSPVPKESRQEPPRRC